MILDTNALSAWRDSDRALLAVLDPGRLYLTVVTVGEYRFGITRSVDRVPSNLWLDDVIREIPVLLVTLETAECYASIRASLQARGRPIPDNDLWIAAIAVEHNLPILSQDRHFDVVDALTRIAW